LEFANHLVLRNLYYISLDQSSDFFYFGGEICCGSLLW